MVYLLSWAMQGLYHQLQYALASFFLPDCRFGRPHAVKRLWQTVDTGHLVALVGVSPQDEAETETGTVMGLSENKGVPYFGVLILRILLFRVLYLGLLFSDISRIPPPPHLPPPPAPPRKCSTPNKLGLVLASVEINLKPYKP